MPELPEVETLKLGLQKYLVGHKIYDVEVRVPKLFQGSVSQIIGAKVVDVKRVGKGLIIELDNGFDLIVHLKMTGQLIYRGSETKGVELSKKTGGELPSKYSHIIFSLDKASKLYFNDLRRFGYIKVIKKQDVKNLLFFKEMGPEPPVVHSTPLGTMEGQALLTQEKLIEILSKSSIAVKPFLMDQKRIGGVGNIYANEALFLAGIDPRRSARQIKKDEAEKLYEAILEVLKKGLKFGGSSDENFVNVLGQDGEYQQHFLAYGKKGEKCSICGGVIEKIQLGGRGTYFCPKHQK